MIKTPHKIQTNDQTMSLIQDSIFGALLPISQKKLLNYIILEDVALASGSNTVPHTLGRAPIGWIVINRSTADTIYNGTTATLLDKYLYLTASGAITVDLLVF